MFPLFKLDILKIYSCVKVYKSESKADRTKYIRSLPLFTSTVLSQWVILYPQQNDNDVRVLIKTIRQFDQGMSFNIPQPEL